MTTTELRDGPDQYVEQALVTTTQIKPATKGTMEKASGQNSPTSRKISNVRGTTILQPEERRPQTQ